MKRLFAAVVLVSAAIPAMAASDLNTLYNLNQSDFRALSEDLGAALSYKALAPAEPLGITGFDIGVELTATSLEHSQVFDKATNGSGLSTLPLAKLHLHK